MLSRIAESLYWVGRYVERAEDTARILDVAVHRTLEDPSVEEDAACRGLLAVMGVKAPEEPLDTVDILDILAFDSASTSSIAGSLFAARENSRSAAEGSATLRSPKEMTTPSTLSSARGSAIASPATFGTARAAPARSIPWEKSQAIAVTPPAASSTVETAVPAATSSTVWPARAPSACRVARRQEASSPAESTVLVRS